jgi:flagellar capping protein FliD
MTPELIAVITCSIALAGLILLQGQRLDRRIDRLEEQMNERFAKLEERNAKLEQRMAALEIQQAKLEGLLEGLREAITRPHAA